jgi:hypothetical protein
MPEAHPRYDVVYEMSVPSADQKENSPDPKLEPLPRGRNSPSLTPVPDRGSSNDLVLVSSVHITVSDTAAEPGDEHEEVESR